MLIFSPHSKSIVSISNHGSPLLRITFHFFFSVACQDFQTHGVLAQDLLTKGVLAELLDQLLSFMTKHDLTKTSSTYYS